MSSDAIAIQELRDVLNTQRKAFLADTYPSIESRTANLHKILGMLMINRQAIRDALKADFGFHHDGATDLMEVLSPSGRATYAVSQLEKWLADDERWVDEKFYGNTKAAIRYQPKGVIGCMIPWNFPYHLSMGPLVEMLAAGNRVIMKPSELSPAVARQLKAMISATFPPDLVYVAVGGHELAKVFSTLRWDHLLYTGSATIGRTVMMEAAKNLVPVTLELGGKCPAIFSDADSVNEKYVKKVIGTKQIKSGQMCITMDTIYVPRASIGEFVELAKAYQQRAGPYVSSEDCTSIISFRHMDRLEKMVSSAKSSGATVINLEPNAESDRKTRRMPLYLVLDPSPDLEIMREEIFGPILPIIPYDGLDDVIHAINEGERPLALYILGDNQQLIDKVVKSTVSGGGGHYTPPHIPTESAESPRSLHGVSADSVGTP